MTRPSPLPLPDVEREALAHAIHETYMEIFPSPSIEQRLDSLEAGSYVAITCSPKRGVDDTLDFTERLTARGFRVVPHIAARMVRDKTHLQGIMRRLADLGVESIFVPGGDTPRPLGTYATAVQLLRDIADFDHRLQHIGVAAHPEGHPAVDPETLLQELSAKQPLATYLVTQMCFDAAAIAAWLRVIRARGITLAVWVGLPGVFDRAALLEVSLRIGVGASLRFLRDRGRIVRRLFGPKTYRLDRFLYELAPRMTDPELGIAGFHLFCFNKVAESEQWRRQFIAGLRRSA
ncbi:MAG: methylenetetrahydrofolate reductase [Gammaproteobacteria bacterium]|nr:methylenetetrahydrofolate reductase [Gammaproteobacteria bacterium]